MTTEESQEGCPNCLSQARTFLMDREHLTFYQCGVCGLEYWKPRESAEEKGDSQGE